MKKANKIIISVLIVVCFLVVLGIGLKHIDNKAYKDNLVEPEIEFLQDDLKDRVYSEDVIITDVDYVGAKCHVEFYVRYRKGYYYAEYEYKANSWFNYSWHNVSIFYYVE